ncbi:hypothetical protein Agabi119p4_8575 [Agaricus bisporus var. burnettii]|uniref:F-box domain-containing protein n=1 Tax=Agaricus bisporus var. burnettii TaxID=192524 RepID=A0A8H7EYK1_AGABI|nr:hypothetical protein Agabi119p4_8575 [Agaricus bisporus var. burnettii]
MHDNTKTDICSLPQEIIISLMAFLNPLDLISLRKTCKYFYDTSHLRIVWLHALAIVCARNNLFVPTFEGDLTTEQLFQAATAPSRFSAFVRKRYRRSLDVNFRKEEYKPLTLDTYTTIDLKLSDQDYGRKLFVVPGGRYIIVMSLETLQLWDAGVRGDGGSEVATKLVATPLQLNKHCYTNDHLCVQHTRSGASLRVAVSSSPAWRPDAYARDSVLVVYEIRPSEVDAKFEEIAMTEIDSLTHIIQLVDDKLVALLDEKDVMVWDFVRDLRAEWSSRPGQYFHDMFVSVDDVMLTDGRGVTQIKLPKLNQGPTLASMEFSITYPGYFGEMKKDLKNIAGISIAQFNRLWMARLAMRERNRKCSSSFSPNCNSISEQGL